MASFGSGFARNAARDNLAGRFYKTFYYWNRAQATCFEVQDCASHALRRLQTSRVLVADQVSDRLHLHTNNPALPLGNQHSSRSISATSPKHSATPGQSKSLETRRISNVNFHADLSTHLRHVMRRVPHAVVVITSAQASTGGLSAETSFRGMTVSSFNTVTLDPVPIVSFNIRIPSSTYEAIQETGGFLVHFLAGTSAGATIANAFARSPNSRGGAFKILATGPAKKDVRIFSGTGTDGAPLIAGAGVLQVLRCRLLEDKGVQLGDHRIVVAEVQSILAQPGIDESSRVSDEGLAYCNQIYRSMGSEIDVSSNQRHATEQADEMVEPAMTLNLRRGDEPML